MFEENNIKNLFEDSVQVKNKILESGQYKVLMTMAQAIARSIQHGNKLMLCGNGGSAADAQHLAAEMLIRLRPHINRKAVPAISLAQDTSTLTACGNDLGYDCIYERMVGALGREGDVLLGITTSGNSNNILKAMQFARENKITVLGFLGEGGGQAAQYCDEAFMVPSKDTGRIQESHITAGHALMESVEDMLLDSKYLSQS